MAGDACQDVGRQMKYYEEAGLLYDGELLPDMIGEDWAAVKNIYYQKLYFSSQEKLCKWLEKEGKFERLYQVATSASQIYPFEEWQLWRIDSLIALESYSQAMEVYQETAKKFSEELNLPPSAEMLKRFHIMGEKITGLPEALDDIQHRLKEREEAEGAYFCTYPSFVDIYHVMGRMMERNGVSVFIMLCTLMYGKNQAAGDSEQDREAGKFLCEAIRGSLRKGDFYTKYNATQYLVMLSGITQENCPIVSNRIDGKFGCMESIGYSVQYYVTSIKDADSVVEDERKNFMDTENIWKK